MVRGVIPAVAPSLPCFRLLGAQGPFKVHEVSVSNKMWRLLDVPVTLG